MQRANVPEKLGLAAILLASACASDHRVSPWGGPASPTLAAFVEAPDLAAVLARIDRETASLRLRPTAELRGKLPGKASDRTLVIRGYEGRDAAGRPVHAVRAATARGVVMAIGPLETSDVDRRAATELVPALVPSEGAGAFRSGTDLNGDGALDVALRSESGELSIYRVGELGSAPYEVEMETRPTRVIDADADGWVDLAGDLPVDARDELGPRLTDVATFVGDRYSDRASGARAFHARRARSLEPPRPAPAAGSAPPAAPPPPRLPDEVRLRRAIERAWHAILAGDPADAALRELRAEPVPMALRLSFERHAFVLEGLARRRGTSSGKDGGPAR